MTVSPYAGLTPYSEVNAPLFFGREREAEVLLANLVSSRLPILYGAKGVGKSSLLRAGVASRLRQDARANLDDYGVPKLAVVAFSSWDGYDPAGELGDAIWASVAELGPDRPRSGASAPSRLDETIARCAGIVEGKVLIILDQFEDYFLYHLGEQRDGKFPVELARAINRADLPAGFLISIRDDAVAKLIPLRELIPRLFDNFQHLEHLDLEAARAAILGPLAVYNHSLGAGQMPVTIEDDLVDAVLDELRLRSFVAPGGVETDSETRNARIETEFLQLVMTRVWAEETEIGSHALRLQTLRRLGGVRQIVSGVIERLMDGLSLNEERVAAEILHFLVTASGATIPQSVPDLAAYSSVDQGELARVLERLSNVRIVRPHPPYPGRAEVRYKVYHDALAGPLLEWVRKHARAGERRSKHFRGLRRR
jgi:hypothetical protein